MPLKEMFKKRTLTPQEKKQAERIRKAKDTLLEYQVPEGLFQKCSSCGKPVYNEDIIENYYICPYCGSYFRVRPRNRIAMVLDKGTFQEWDERMETSDPLNFPGYKKKLERQKSVTNMDEAVITGKGEIGGKEVVIAVMGADFMMGSMGEVVGEKITRAVERATEMRLPVIIFTCSGGARMQEGIISLMQMAKTSAALRKHDEAGLLYITVLTDPTTGGVTASFAMLGDVILAEPGALVGFAGPRVIEQTIGQKLPEGFQRSEFLLEHGFVDKIVERKNLRKVLNTIIRSCEYEQ
ncbi:MAG TPA: acetyl-CoA carboxylase, carboxyltransferase subunit beta [Candidatus Anaerostipes avicola]|uniref:Acetyl-coenzyme A carboxylase carboxyl transferase subunit beta n=1 Tax=Anaerostipes butyraticus TaxID=645466 RepID=A0A916QA80_9FIRM|nr:acetyl-coenzyme A carboxylase carboxyl transferase subunit beta [Anaerostipes butyraticus]HJC82740.1 acetyl-CoA carboxylase, carboxyltransferase subunit beta [Candidatus Anaerostipes avicola]